MIIGERHIGQLFLMAVMASAYGEQTRDCPLGTSAMPERGSSRHTSQVTTVSCWGADIDGSCLSSTWLSSLLSGCTSCVLPRDLQRVGTAFACNCSTSYFAIQACSRVLLLCSAFKRGHEHVVQSKMAVAYCKCSANRPTISLTHSLSECHSLHVNANCYCRALGQRLWQK